MCTEISTKGQSRKWECKRCCDPINILVQDDKRKFVIDGENIFCGRHCMMAYREHIPVKLAKNKSAVKYKKASNKKEKDSSIFKCFSCNSEYNYMTWDKFCPECRDSKAKENQARINTGEFLTNLVGGLTNEQRSIIRLSKIS